MPTLSTEPGSWKRHAGPLSLDTGLCARSWHRADFRPPGPPGVTGAAWDWLHRQGEARGLNWGTRVDNRPVVWTADSASQASQRDAFIAEIARNNGSTHAYHPLFAQHAQVFPDLHTSTMLCDFPPNQCVEKEIHFWDGALLGWSPSGTPETWQGQSRPISAAQETDQPAVIDPGTHTAIFPGN